jgi:uncharacterized protein
MLEKLAILIGIGLVTGTVTAISAGSGVTIVVPLLTIFLGYTIHSAIGTSLLVDVIASLIVAYNYFRYGRVDLKAGAWLALGAIIGAQIGSHFASLIPQNGLKGGFVIFIIISGISFIYRAFGKRKLNLDILKLDNQVLHKIMIILVGVVIGLSTGLFGTGGGATIMVVLTFLMDFPIHTAIGTATALMAITATSGVIGYTIQGHIPWLDGIIIGVAAMISGLVFSKYANRASEKTLNLAVGIIFIVIGIAMFFVEGGTKGVMESLLAFIR